MTELAQVPPVPLPTACLRGLRGRCPKCGKGKLFRAYLKQVDHCAVCGEAFAHIRADDAPAWLTILFVGHLVVFTALLAQENLTLPEWVSLVLWPGVTLVLALAVLPRAKGLFIAAIWAMKAPGSEEE